MGKITFIAMALGVSFLQGYFFPVALFKFMPFVVEHLRTSTKGHYDGKVKEFLIRTSAMIMGSVVVVLVLPGFLQLGVVWIMDLSGDTMSVAAKGSAAGWLFGIITKGLVTQVGKARKVSNEPK